MLWDPFGTLGQALWIGGGQWAGKSTVARLLALRHGVPAYHYDYHDYDYHDYHDARGHNDRRIAQRVRLGQPPDGPDPEAVWVETTPEAMAADTLAGFPDRFAWVLDDLRGLVSGRPIIAEGWGLRPNLVAPILDAPRRMIVLVPSAEFREHQARALPRAATFGHTVSDPARAQRNRIGRDALVAEDAVRSAERLGIREYTVDDSVDDSVDGSVDAPAVADVVAEYFSPYLPPVTG